MKENARARAQYLARVVSASCCKFPDLPKHSRNQSNQILKWWIEANYITGITLMYTRFLDAVSLALHIDKHANCICKYACVCARVRLESVDTLLQYRVCARLKSKSGLLLRSISFIELC